MAGGRSRGEPSGGLRDQPDLDPDLSAADLDPSLPLKSGGRCEVRRCVGSRGMPALSCRERRLSFAIHRAARRSVRHSSLTCSKDFFRICF
jgi:hypothetical protein